MLPIIMAIIYTIMSVAIVLLMSIKTNKRLTGIQPDENDELIKSTPYTTKEIAIVTLILAIISAICGYMISKNAISLIANIQIGVCYMASLAAAVIDIKTHTIPNFITISIICVRVLVFIYEVIFTDTALSYLLSSVVGCLLCAILLIIANRVSKGGIGGGDIKLLSGIGLMCGIYVVFSTLLLSLIACVIVSAILVAVKKKKIKEHLPFGPFIYLGMVVMCAFTLY